MKEKMYADLMDSFVQISKLDGFVDHIHKAYQYNIQDEMLKKTNISKDEYKMLMCTGYFEIIRDFKE